MRASDWVTSSRDVTRFSAIAFCMSGMVASTTENFVATANRIARCVMARECSFSGVTSAVCSFSVTKKCKLQMRPLLQLLRFLESGSRLRHVDFQHVSVDFLAIQSGDRGASMIIVGILDKAKAARHTVGAILGDARRVRRTVRIDHLTELRVTHVRYVSD